MEDMLVAGEIPAAIGVQVDSPDVKPLIPNAREAGFAALRERGLYPINHTVVVKNDVLAAHPGLATDLFRRSPRRSSPTSSGSPPASTRKQPTMCSSSG